MSVKILHKYASYPRKDLLRTFAHSCELRRSELRSKASDLNMALAFRLNWPASCSHLCVKRDGMHPFCPTHSCRRMQALFGVCEETCQLHTDSWNGVTQQTQPPCTPLTPTQRTIIHGMSLPCYASYTAISNNTSRTSSPSY